MLVKLMRKYMENLVFTVAVVVMLVWDISRHRSPPTEFTFQLRGGAGGEHTFSSDYNAKYEVIVW